MQPTLAEVIPRVNGADGPTLAASRGSSCSEHPHFWKEYHGSHPTKFERKSISIRIIAGRTVNNDPQRSVALVRLDDETSNRWVIGARAEAAGKEKNKPRRSAPHTTLY